VSSTGLGRVTAAAARTIESGGDALSSHHLAAAAEQVSAAAALHLVAMALLLGATILLWVFHVMRMHQLPDPHALTPALLPVIRSARAAVTASSVGLTAGLLTAVAWATLAVAILLRRSNGGRIFASIAAYAAPVVAVPVGIVAWLVVRAAS